MKNEVVNPEQETYTEKEKNITWATLSFICRPVSHHQGKNPYVYIIGRG